MNPWKWRSLGLATFLASCPAGAAPSATQIALCESCHGKEGNSETPMIPSIAGQPATFLANQLIFYREGLRAAKPPSAEGLPSMQDIAERLKDKDVTALADHFARRAVRAPAVNAIDPKLEKRGRQIADSRHCGQCHLPDYRGRAQMPRLAAQREDYLVDTMKSYRDGKRTGADTTMIDVLDGLSDPDIAALGHFLARRK